MSTVVVTGASGFVGRALCARLAAAGWAVRAGVRQPGGADFGHPAVAPFACDLPGTLDPEAFDGADAVVHAAYATRGADRAAARAVNVAGTARVLRAARRARARFVFVSSCSAHADALSYYGRSKFALEARLDPARDLVVRPGLVLGGGGLFARMTDTLARARVVPLFDGGRQPLQTVHVDDLAAAMESLVAARAAGLHVLAEDPPVSMGVFLRALAGRLGVRPWFVPVPSAAVLPAVRAAERLGLALPVGSENLLGLRGMVHQPPSPWPAAHGLRLRGWRESLAALLPG